MIVFIKDWALILKGLHEHTEDAIKNWFQMFSQLLTIIVFHAQLSTKKKQDSLANVFSSTTSWTISLWK